MHTHQTGKHFKADKNENERQAFLQMVKFMHYPFKHKEQRPHTKNGKNIRRKDNERLLWDGKSSRNRIYRKYDIRSLDKQYNQKQRSKQ